MLSTIQVPEYDIFQEVREYVKIYPNYLRLYSYDTPIKHRIAGFEPSHVELKSAKSGSNPDNITRSLRRTKTAITDLCLCNDFDLFCTFTFKKDRQNVEKSKSKMKSWLHNQQNRVGAFSYLIVPEYHKDGKSLHFHALFKSYKGSLKKTHLLQNGRNIYNITSYKSGFSTAVPIDNKEKVSNYIRKYITKDMPEFAGKHRYWSSKGLIRPQKLINPNLPTDIRKSFIHEFSTENLTVSKLDLNVTELTKRGAYLWQD